MPTRSERLVEELRALSDDERADVLAQVLPAADVDDGDDAWNEELGRRVAQVLDGTAQLRDFDSSYAELAAKFQKA